MGRRLLYREAAENIVRGMIDQLSAMTDGPWSRSSPSLFGLLNCASVVLPLHFCGTTPKSLTEEREIRAAFNVEQGSNLPADLCLCVENMPTKWNVVPIEEHSFEGISSGYREDYREFLPIVDNDLLTEVCASQTSHDICP